MRVAAVICANGLGHFRRLTELLVHLAERVEISALHLFCEEWQLNTASSWPHIARLRKLPLHIVSGVMEPGVGWNADPAVLSDGRLHAWEQRIKGIAAIRDADLVLSDNLVGVLDIRADAVLVGSFFWGNILGAAFPREPAVRAFSCYEAELLQVYRPNTICVDHLAMPALLDGTRPIAVGFMCGGALLEVAARANRGGGGVAVLGGATTAAQRELAAVAPALAEQTGASRVCVDRRIMSALPAATQSKVELFGFDARELCSLDAMVCRPGTGTITECVGAGVPMVFAYEASNSEMVHNAKAMADLGAAVDLGPGATCRAVTDALISVRRDSFEMRQALARLSKDGFARAADWLYEHTQTQKDSNDHRTAKPSN